MKFRFKKYATAGLMGLVFALGTATGHSQMVIREIDAVYKSKDDGRIIPMDEFQSYRGRYIFHELIKGKKDTIVITVPKKVDEDHTEKAFLAQIGKSHSPFTAVDIHGKQVSSEQLKGKVVVLNFWFVACPPCVREIPELNRLVTQYKDRDVVFVSFARDTEALLGKFLAGTRFDYLVIPDATAIANQYKVHAYPSHMVIDANGVVRYAATGLSDNSLKELEKAIVKSIDR